ncbi:MutL family mismatch-repair protein Pms1 [Schizosaccharomyces japonicus yFS275]|uniref:DNA mismatch repair protein PMS1 n=1 Tax=Schizosaccharomyces japonicus (strain yFS275 / FY16936) TaxID=402676 RepID=B6K1S5_SCHJY|nr:MutL family mismatch-repair protein Pms1 [Schizosaccharomyces japonicus yFS275]EEB07106.2 MutL family mismatch-repair protein Pms1 [Schizosaccharomyces japonicus yFS275]
MSIRPIDKKSIHRICSGQVITDIASAVKELVENSLDAGATNIEIRFKHYGLDTIEVVDNGNGISSDDHACIAKKYYTSKLNEFEDLSKLGTFGFRGEALSSLCALSDLQVSTATAQETPKGHSLTFNHEGDLVKHAVVPFQKGTMITVQNIFSTLPVRRKHLERNYKKEYSKALVLLQMYAVVSVNKRILVYHQPKGGGRQLQLSSNKNPSMLKNIMNVFGTKVSSSLTAWNDDFINGYISRPQIAGIKSSSEGQMLFLNGRPITHPKVHRLIMEVYRSFSVNQSPFFAVNLVLPEDYCKKFAIRYSLCDQTEYSLSQAKPYTPKVLQKPEFLRSSPPLQSDSSLNSPLLAFGNSDTSVSSDKKRLLDSQSLDAFESAIGDSPLAKKSRTLLPAINEKVEEQIKSPDGPVISHDDRPLKLVLQTDQKGPPQQKESVHVASLPMTSALDQQGNPSTELLDENPTPLKSQSLDIFSTPKSAARISKVQTLLPSFSLSTTHSNAHPPAKSASLQKVRFLQGKSGDMLFMKTTSKTVNLSELKDRFQTLKKYNSFTSAGSGKATLDTIHDITDTHAEEHLDLSIHKSDFLCMRIIGQFNCGFIIVRHAQNLFIIDQHASDEKYNYEKLKRNCVLSAQDLVAPKQLNLAVNEELALLDHLPIIEKKGFRVTVDETAPIGKRCKLVSVPSSSHTIFDVSDLLEMLGLLVDHPEMEPSSSKIEKMLAMKACRRSIMVGRSLTISEMTSVVRHLATLSKPWNCPHGRPTMRHLLRLRNLKAHDASKTG